MWNFSAWGRESIGGYIGGYKGVIGGYVGIMEKKMEATMWGLEFGVWA